MTLQAANKKMCIKHMLLNNWPMLNFNLQDIKIKWLQATLFSDTHRQVAQTNEKCINKLATCFKFIPGSHGQCVVKPHTAQSLYQILRACFIFQSLLTILAILAFAQGKDGKHHIKNCVVYLKFPRTIVLKNLQWQTGSLAAEFDSGHSPAVCQLNCALSAWLWYVSSTVMS